VLDVHTLLFSILISTTGMIHLNKEKWWASAVRLWTEGG